MEMVGKTRDRVARSPPAVTHNRGGILVLCFFCWALPLAPLLPYQLDLGIANYACAQLKMCTRIREKASC